MIIKSVIATNFGSYEYVAFEPDNQGLCLISGPTGCGKSTIPDIVSWGLYGITAKNGAVDDVLRWDADGEFTEVSIVVEVKNQCITVTRRRGAGKNDLFWEEDGVDGEHRGNNLTETQVRLSARLSCDGATFLSAAYYTETNDVANFFTANAKRRRETLEQMVDLSLPVLISERAAEKKKATKTNLKAVQSSVDKLTGSLEQAESYLKRTERQAEQWEQDHKKALDAAVAQFTNFEEIKTSKLDALQTKYDSFEAATARTAAQLVEKLAKVDALLTTAKSNHISCNACGTIKGAEEVARLTGSKKLLLSQSKTNAASINPFVGEMDFVMMEENKAEARIEQLMNTVNPHIAFLQDTKNRLEAHREKHEKALDEQRALLTGISSLEQIYDLSFDLRGLVLQNAVKRLEDATNTALEHYFESSFRVAFTVEGGDALDVEITKDGYACSYSQLSKGQKQLLRLCFSVSAMDVVANNTGMHFQQLFLDEALDGLDAALKVKAFSLFEKLAKNRSSVFIIEHAPEFQSLFDNSWQVQLIGGHSELDSQRA